MKPKRWRLYAAAWAADFAAFLVVFAISRTLAERGTDILTMGLLGGLWSIAMSASMLGAGRLSDRIGRRRVMVAGLILAMAGIDFLLCVSTDSWAIAVAYLMVGWGNGMFYPATCAWLTQGLDNGKTATVTRTLITFSIAWNLGMISGQLSGGWMFNLLTEDPSLLLALALLAGNVVLILWPGQSEKAPLSSDAPAPQSPTAFDRQARSAAFARLSWIANAGGTFSMSMIFFLFPKLMVSLDVPPQAHGLIVALSRAMVVLTYLFMYWSHFWHYRLSTAFATQILAVAGLLTIVWADTIVATLVGLMGLSVLAGYNYFASLYYSTTGSTDDRKGAMVGFHDASLTVGFAAGSVGGGLLGRYAGEILGPDAGLRSPYALAAAVVAALSIVQILVIRRRHTGGRTDVLATLSSRRIAPE